MGRHVNAIYAILNEITSTSNIGGDHGFPHSHPFENDGLTRGKLPFYQRNHHQRGASIKLAQVSVVSEGAHLKSLARHFFRQFAQRMAPGRVGSNRDVNIKAGAGLKQGVVIPIDSSCTYDQRRLRGCNRLEEIAIDPAANHVQPIGIYAEPFENRRRSFRKAQQLIDARTEEAALKKQLTFLARNIVNEQNHGKVSADQAQNRHKVQPGEFFGAVDHRRFPTRT